MRTINARMIEEVLRVATVPLDFEQDREIVEEVYYEAANPEEIESLMELTGPEELLEEGDLARIMQDLLDSMTPREAKVLKLRFGIGVDKEYTFDEIAKIFEVSRERIRQIEAKALRKMRHPSRSDRIKVYVGWDIPDDPFPDINHYYGTMEGLVYYHDAVAAWHERQKAAKMKLEKIRAELKKGMLV